MPYPTGFEQETLELINRARADPAGEYDALVTAAAADANIANNLRYFGTDLEAFQQQIAGLPAVAPLAWNTSLAQASQTHTAQMIAADVQSHQLPGEAGLRERVEDAGYTGLRSIGENIFAFTQNAVFGHFGFYVDWGLLAEYPTTHNRVND